MDQFSIEQNASGVPFIRYQGAAICTVADMAAFMGFHLSRHPELVGPVAGLDAPAIPDVAVNAPDRSLPNWLPDQTDLTPGQQCQIVRLLGLAFGLRLRPR
jgi:hypothetical protein